MGEGGGRGGREEIFLLAGRGSGGHVALVPVVVLEVPVVRVLFLLVLFLVLSLAGAAAPPGADGAGAAAQGGDLAVAFVAPLQAAAAAPAPDDPLADGAALEVRRRDGVHARARALLVHEDPHAPRPDRRPVQDVQRVLRDVLLAHVDRQRDVRTVRVRHAVVAGGADEGDPVDVLDRVPGTLVGLLVGPAQVALRDAAGVVGRDGHGGGPPAAPAAVAMVPSPLPPPRPVPPADAVPAGLP